MQWYAGPVRDSTGRSNGRVTKISQQRTLVFLDDNTFAVRADRFFAGNCPYIEPRERLQLTVSLDGHSYGSDSDAVTAEYQVFARSNVSLPNTCIESAEHVLKCTHKNAHHTRRIGNNRGPRVTMSCGERAADIDNVDMPEFASETFPRGLETAVDATSAGFQAGEGMALVYSRDPGGRSEGAWTVHAVAVLLNSTYVWDPFLVVSEVMAPDDGRRIGMTADWDLSVYKNAQDFKDSDPRAVPSDTYTLWKLSAADR
jgi:hypothetical protein